MYYGHGIVIEVLYVAMESLKVASVEGVSKIALTPRAVLCVYVVVLKKCLFRAHTACLTVPQGKVKVPRLKQRVILLGKGILS